VKLVMIRGRSSVDLVRPGSVSNSDPRQTLCVLFVMLICRFSMPAAGGRLSVVKIVLRGCRNALESIEHELEMQVVDGVA